MTFALGAALRARFLPSPRSRGEGGEQRKLRAG